MNRLFKQSRRSVRGPALVVEAVQDGKLAARAIGAALSQEVKE